MHVATAGVNVGLKPDLQAFCERLAIGNVGARRCLARKAIAGADNAANTGDPAGCPYKTAMFANAGANVVMKPTPIPGSGFKEVVILV